MDAMRIPQDMVFGLDIGTRSIVGTVGFKQNERDFVVVAQSVRFHETRAMLDGQIHDIGKVAETITEVRRELEAKIGRKLTDVCIAAAGRVLKTVEAQVDYPLEGECIVSAEHIRSMELVGAEKAHAKLREKTSKSEDQFFCVGYTVISYFLNGIQINNLEGHKATHIGAKVLATFLPGDVIDGLYAAVERSKLSVCNITLEPIAAINVAIPEKFRLLNLALVDIGAGTSDICITKDGSITAYGMIPSAGDVMTEKIMREYLVEFNVAEEIKLAIGSKKPQINFVDIMGIKQKVSRTSVLEKLTEEYKKLAKLIADKVLELNGGKMVSACFVVGGGGKHPKFVSSLAEAMKLPKERVALRGEEVMGNIHFLDNSLGKDPATVTPIGICLNYYEQNNNFIFVQVNGERIKLFDNRKLTVMDAALAFGYPNEKLFPRRGKELNFTVDGVRRMVRGGAGESSIIKVNKKMSSIFAPITGNDVIEITESTQGEPASAVISSLPEFKSKLSFYFNDKKVSCPKFMSVNGELVSGYYSIQDGDEIVCEDYYTLDQILTFMDIPKGGNFLINNIPALPEDKVYENFTVETLAAAIDEEEVASSKEPAVPLVVVVNDRAVRLEGKTSYVFVDILDFYEFDVSAGNEKICRQKKNGEFCDFTTPIDEGDRLEIFFEDPVTE